MSSRADVIVVGAGSSGAAVSAMLAERGLRVICVERKRLDEAGARWMNGVPRAAFTAAGVAMPSGDESDGTPMPFHLVATTGRAHVPEHDVVEVDMRKLVARLQARAAAAGVDLRDDVSVVGREGGRVTIAATGEGGRRTTAATRPTTSALEARWIIDASGVSGARLLEQPRIGRSDLCAAAQQVHEVVDRPAAAAYFESHGVGPGEVLGFVGVAGGYSILNVRLHHGAATMAILTGSIPALGFPSGKAMLAQFVAEHRWVGARVYGGTGAIPLRRAHDRLADDHVALLGDAACQVFPAHGSGVGSGLVAARMLADTLASGGSPRDYEVAWQRRHGGVFAFFDVFRRWNQSVDAATLGKVMALGLLDPETLRAGIDQTLPRPTLRSLAAKARALASEPALASRIAAAAARSAAVRAMYTQYPRDPARVPAWSRRVDWLLGA